MQKKKRVARQRTIKRGGRAYELWEEADEGGTSSQLLPPISCSRTPPPSCFPTASQKSSSTATCSSWLHSASLEGLGSAVPLLSSLGYFLETLHHISPRPLWFPFPQQTYPFWNYLNLFLCRQLYMGFWSKEEVKAIDPNDAMDNLWAVSFALQDGLLGVAQISGSGQL